MAHSVLFSPPVVSFQCIMNECQRKYVRQIQYTNNFLWQWVLDTVQFMDNLNNNEPMDSSLLQVQQARTLCMCAGCPDEWLSENVASLLFLCGEKLTVKVLSSKAINGRTAELANIVTSLCLVSAAKIIIHHKKKRWYFGYFTCIQALTYYPCYLGGRLISSRAQRVIRVYITLLHITIFLTLKQCV